MKPRLKWIHCPDVDDLPSFSPGNRQFGVLFQLMVGPDGGEGEESFDVLVCTPDWFAERITDGPLLGRGYVFVRSFDFSKLEVFLRKQVERVEGDTWQEIGMKLARFARWEFDDYADR